MNFRYATLKDADWLINKLGQDMLTLWGNTDYFDPIYLKDIFFPYILKEGVCIVAEENGNLAGSIAGKKHPFIYNPAKTTLAELVWYVAPEYRKSSAGLKLLRYFELWGIENKVDLITLSTMPSTELSDRALLKRGYSLREFSYVRNL